MSMSSAQTCKISNRTHLLLFTFWKMRVLSLTLGSWNVLWRWCHCSISTWNLTNKSNRQAPKIRSMLLEECDRFCLGSHDRSAGSKFTNCFFGPFEKSYATFWALYRTHYNVVFTTFLVFKFVLFWKWTWPRVWSIRRFCPCIDCRYLCLFSTLFLDCVVTSFHFFSLLQSVIFDEIALPDLSVAECSTKNVNHSFQVTALFTEVNLFL